jgi:hypothetical protein
MWPFRKKTLCEQQGHSWNELGGHNDGFGGTIMVPFDGTCCLHCPEIYKAPPRPEPKVGDKLNALQWLIQNYAHMRGLAERYPTYARFGTYRLWLDHNHTIDAEIQGLWESL